MTIPINYYIDINSIVGGANAFNLREYILRAFTNNVLLPPNSFIESTSAFSIGSYFGTDSPEYARAAFYFEFISKLGLVPNKISFARWVDTAVAPMIFGQTLAISPLTTLQAISTGSFSLTIGGTTHTVGPLDFTSVVSLADVADVIQTKINSFSGTQWTAATVAYDATRKSFNFVGGDDTVDADISVTTSGVGVDIRNLIGWNSFAIYAAGSTVETLTDTLTASVSASNNFGSFLFMPDLTDDQKVEIAQWVQLYNFAFMYLDKTTISDSATLAALIAEYNGVGITVSEIDGEFPEQLPAAAFAATDYTAPNGTLNYMWLMQAGLTASVTDIDTAQTLDALFINYYGVTQTAGQYRSLYQRGQLQHNITGPQYMNVYANEIWLKDAVGTSLFNLQVALPKISANTQGRSQILAILQPVINQALLNGTISVGAPLTDIQKSFITTATGDNTAWQQVQTSGYWVDCVFVLVDNEYQANYTIVYRKDDLINKINGVHILI